MPWDPRIQALVERYPALRAVGNTPLVPVDIFRRELPEVEVFSKMESLNPGGSLKDRPGLRMLLAAVDGVGTGGTLTGLGRRLKEHDPAIRLICVIPEAFPGVEGLKPLGRAEDIVPAILDEKIIDERVPVTVDEAYQMCVRLAAAGFFVGQSSGAYMAGVLRVAQQVRRGRFVTIFNDLGERYFSTRLWD